MINIPKKERTKFETMLCGQAQGLGLDSQEYLRKVWYHEQASKLGEYTAMVLVNDLLELLPVSPIVEQKDTDILGRICLRN